MMPVMDTSTIDREFGQLQAEFQDVAKTVESLAAKMQAAEKAGDANATEWLADLKQVAQDVDDEQAQVKALLLAVHGFIGSVAQAQQVSAVASPEDKPPLFAPGHEPESEDEAAQQPASQRHGMLGGMLGGMMGGGMMGGGMFGGYYGGGFGRAMEMGMAMNLGANLVNSIFR
jgi:seryl-tRNA synthetase